jgi:hypothetical protein
VGAFGAFEARRELTLRWGSGVGDRQPLARIGRIRQQVSRETGLGSPKRLV